MFEEMIRSSSVVQFVTLHGDEEGDNVRVIVRVTDEAAWPKLMVRILRQAIEDEDYQVQVYKEFYLDEELRPKFAWVIAVQGDVDLAIQNLTPVFAKKFAKAPPPVQPPPVVAERVVRSVEQEEPGTRPKPQRRVIRGDTEAYEATTIRLPFQRGNRDRSPEEVVRVMDKKRGIRAAVRGVTG
jgi:hypothetical protein